MQQRSRKCSIVREEEDDEESAVPASRQSDSRRGSRSEGRLHLAARAHASPALCHAAAAPPPAPHRTHLSDNLTRVSNNGYNAARTHCSDGVSCGAHIHKHDIHKHDTKVTT